MNVIDLFSGVGGLSEGFKQAGFDIIYANEFNESIANSYKLNHPETDVDSRDIQDIDLNRTFKKYKNKIDVLVGGPPCQGFSQKGSRKGLKDDRNFLFKYYISVINIIKPKFFLMENVTNILTSNNGFFINEIKKEFELIGYEIKYKSLLAHHYGIPQKRKRAFIIGSKEKVPFTFPGIIDEQITVQDAISDLPKLVSGEGAETQNYLSKPINNFQKNIRNNSLNVYNHISTRHSEIALERLSLVKIGGNKNDLPKAHRTKSIYSGTWERLDPNGFAPTITTRFDTPSSGRFTLPYQDRCLTVREAARLQSFPDTFIFHGKKTSQMIQVGNAVPPLLARKIANQIKSFM